MAHLPRFVFLVVASMVLFLIGCGTSRSTESEETTTVISLPDTLRVGTLYSPTSYFMYKGEIMGYEYELISKFAEDKKIQLKFVLAQNMTSMIELLDSGDIDVIAYEIPITSEYKNKVLHCGAENITHQVLIQLKNPKQGESITDVTQLINRDVYVEKNSKYESRLRNLDNELGGGIKIHSINQDTLITEDLIEMVAEGKLPLTIVDNDIAKLNKTYYDNIDISLEVSFPQRASWAVNKDNSWLADSINSWSNMSQNKVNSKKLLKRYFELSKNTIPKIEIKLEKGRISIYDHLFQHYAKEINWDWRLLAAQAYCESRFDTAAVSWAGAKGLMQLMPRTARAFGIGSEEMSNPEASVRGAVALIKELNKSFSKRVPDEQERLKFIVAAYNSGLGHVYDAMALAEKHGRNNQIWYGNVAEMILLKSNPEYFNDPVCKFGYFKGKETTKYVAEVENIYNLYKVNFTREKSN